MNDQNYVLANVREALKAAFDIDPQSVSIETNCQRHFPAGIRWTFVPGRQV